MKILVTRNELAKRLSRQQRFGGEQRTALVDVDEPPLERRPFVPELTLRAHRVLRRRVDLGIDCRQLSIERGDETLRCRPARIQIRDFLGQIVHVRA